MAVAVNSQSIPFSFCVATALNWNPDQVLRGGVPSVGLEHTAEGHTQCWGALVHRTHQECWSPGLLSPPGAKGILVTMYSPQAWHLLAGTPWHRTCQIRYPSENLHLVGQSLWHYICIPLMLVRGTRKAPPPLLQKAGHPWQIGLFAEPVAASRNLDIPCSTIHFSSVKSQCRLEICPH